MEKVMRLLSLIIALVFQYGFTQKTQIDRKVIIIDAGHGGIDSGAVAINGLEEKDVVLSIANHILYWNNTLSDNEYDIYLTRTKDSLISLRDRSKLAQFIKPDIFISLHCNHAINKRAVGVEAYVYRTNNETELLNQSGNIAKRMLDELGKNLGFKSRGLKKANFQVLRETVDSCPAILLELGFLSNHDEAGYLKNEKGRKALALAILLSIKIDKEKVNCSKQLSP